MFDDTPDNLPTGEPAPANPAKAQSGDGSLQMPETPEPAPASQPKPGATPPDPAMAEDPFEGIDTGGLPAPNVPPGSTAPSQQPSSQAAAKKLAGKKWLIPVIIGAVVLVTLGIVGFVFANFFKTIITANEAAVVESVTPTVDTTIPRTSTTPNRDEDSMVTTTPTTTIIPETTPTETLPPPSDKVPPATPVDSDGDGLSDVDEAGIGTSPRKPDSDNDGLFDREEVEVYLTDPLVADTDGDGFIDGEEVSNGYNPNGEGRLFDIPTE